MTRRSDDRDQLQLRLVILERKLDNLKWMMGTQTVLLSILMLTYLLSLARWLVVFLLVAVPLLVIFRDRIPAWSRRIGSSFARFWRKGDEVSRSPARSKSSA